MPDLTAAELHALVNSRYVMPDGSSRRGLWERVPDTRPGQLHFLRGCTIEECECGLVSYWEYNGSRVGKDTVEESPDGTAAASALIRVAIEDWFVQNGGFHTQHVDTGPNHFQVYLRGGRDGCFAPQMLGALVAAAHSLADALGVPH